MPVRDSRLQIFSKYQRRALSNYKRLLKAAGLNPDRVLDFAAHPVAVIPLLRDMTDHVVRGEVILEYSVIDWELDLVLLHHFFGKNLQAAGRTRRYKTLRLMLQNLYIMQKLAIVRRFKDVPRAVASNIAAINDLRNGLAHNFFLEDLSPSKRTYKGLNIFTVEGLNALRRDASEVCEFLNPEVHRLMWKPSFMSAGSSPKP